jgi:acyl transferase domain-containing protein
MTPFNFKVAGSVAEHRLALLAAVASVLLAAPAGAQQPPQAPAGGQAPAAGQQITQALQAQVQTDQQAAKDQKEIKGIQDRTQDAAGRYAQAMADADSLERYNKQLDAQVKSQETEMASIERQLMEIETTTREVQPLMQQMVDTLDQFVKLDVPFLLDERTARVQNLKDMMARADVTISEKYRRILEAYQIELEYGRTLDAYEGRLGTGADARTVEFVRLGRVSLMYRTLDGSEVGYWDAEQKKWVPDASYSEDIQQALRVARGQGAKELLIVPVPAPKEVRS